MIPAGVSVQRRGSTVWSRGGRIPIPRGTRLELESYYSGGGRAGAGGCGWSLPPDGCSRRSLSLVRRLPLGAPLVDEGGQISATYSPKSQQPDVYAQRVW